MKRGQGDVQASCVALLDLFTCRSNGFCAYCVYIVLYVGPGLV